VSSNTSRLETSVEYFEEIIEESEEEQDSIDAI
jgi:hypothetical protein